MYFFTVAHVLIGAEMLTCAQCEGYMEVFS